ncbi:MAG: kynureninase [Spirochaetes bacterium]|nr:kynureninase [Spirochaetota bacterium]
MRHSTSRSDAERLDRDDPLKSLRGRFDLPAGVVYLDGNSLGALPKNVAERVYRVVTEEWGRDLITSWNLHGWMELPSRVGGRIAPLIGATTGEVVCADSTSINVFKLLAAALKLNPDRSTILSDSGNFPTDLYMAQGLGELIGGARRLRVVDEETLVDSIDENTAVVMATHVNYRTGRRHDMQAVTRRAHELGALMLWDLAHSAGAMPIELDAVRADFAVGCGYKYLNGGPGAPAFLYVAERHLDSVRPPLSGWLGHEAPFAFDLEYRPASGIERNRVGTPAILNMAALDAALDVFDGVDMKQVREKSVALAEYFIELVEERCGEFSVELVSPRNASARGSQVSFRHPQAYAVMQALIERGFIGDFRAPDVLRFGFAPLYVRYVDAWDTAAALRDILETGAWDQEKFRVKSRVT